MANSSPAKKSTSAEKKFRISGVYIVLSVILISICTSLVPFVFPDYQWNLIGTIKSYFLKKEKEAENKLNALIEPETLNLLLKQKDFNHNFRIVEAFFGTESEETFNKEHIPDSLYFDSMHSVEPSKVYPKKLPTEQEFKNYISSLGISNNHHVIIYDRSEYGFFASSRVWLMFRIFGHESVSILNGGLNKWKLKKFELSNTIVNFEPSDFKTNLNRGLLVDYDDVIKNLETKKQVIIDAREKSDFEKVNQETGKADQIPGSLNVPYSQLFDNKTKCIKDIPSLEELFEQNGVDLSKSLISSCYTGVKASSLAFAAYLLGADNVPLYSGSWTEFSQRSQS